MSILYTVVRRFRPVRIFVLLLFVVSVLASKYVFAQEIGQYALTSEHLIGRVSTKVINDGVAIRFDDLKKRTTYTKWFKLSEIDLEKPVFEGPNYPDGFTPVVGEYWQFGVFKTGYKVARPGSMANARVEAIFSNFVLLRPATEAFSEAYTPTRDYLIQKDIMPGTRSLQLIDTRFPADTLEKFLSETKENVLLDLENLIKKEEKVIQCIKFNKCNFEISYFSSPDLFEKVEPSYDMQIDIEKNESTIVKSRSELIQILRKQIGHLKFYWIMHYLEHLKSTYLKLGPFTTNISALKMQITIDSELLSKAEAIKKSDIFGGQALRALNKLPVKSLRASYYLVDLGLGSYGKYDAEKEMANFYLTNIYKMIYMNPYLAWVNGDLSEDGLENAMTESLAALRRLRDVVFNIQGADELMLSAFVFATERTTCIKDYSCKGLLNDLLISKYNGYKDVKLVSSLSDSKFLMIMGCLGITMFSPMKYGGAFCNIASLVEVAHNLKNRFNLNFALRDALKMEQIDAYIYSQDKRGLIKESITAAIFSGLTIFQFKDLMKNDVGEGVAEHIISQLTNTAVKIKAMSGVTRPGYGPLLMSFWSQMPIAAIIRRVDQTFERKVLTYSGLTSIFANKIISHWRKAGGVMNQYFPQEKILGRSVPVLINEMNDNNSKAEAFILRLSGI